MTEFMKDIVGQILNQSQTEAPSEEKNIASSQLENRTSSIEAINRPNYQYQNKEKRLSIHPDKKSSSGDVATREKSKLQPKQPDLNVTAIPKHYDKDTLSNLHRMSLVQGNEPIASGNRDLGAAKMIGKSKSGGSAWLFPNPSETIGKFFRRNPQKDAVGVVHSPESLPSQLMFLHSILCENPEVKFYIEWDKGNEGEFLLELYHQDAGFLKKILNNLFQQINRRAMKSHETYSADFPSAWLSKQLGIHLTVERLSIIEGLSYYSNISLLDHVMKSIPEGTINFDVENSYLLVAGNSDVVSEVEEVIKKNGGQFIE
ncbi:hypothetical protein HNR44_000191 [Geomicrobium halophilum]|uniref:Uncharacterized protein n=1 Tax=Geomicrobium halophilum TaxID=549000 RepID=A0A841PWB5_9BACL|nr:hypothetical protein [Geomicrobium halophilum]MBB6448242.1 hypothetical protein [Geomicrobium halophilum]